MEKLKNCPNCGGILNDAGRCVYCGSKVYDLCDIDVTGRHRGPCYIRIKTDNRVVLAPVRTDTVMIEMAPDSFTTMDVRFIVLGNVTMIENAEDSDK